MIECLDKKTCAAESLLAQVDTLVSEQGTREGTIETVETLLFKDQAMETLFDALSAFNREHGIEEPELNKRPGGENAHPNVTPGGDDDISEKKEKKRKHKKDKKKKKSKKQRAPTTSEEESEPEEDNTEQSQRDGDGDDQKNSNNPFAGQFGMTPRVQEEIKVPNTIVLRNEVVDKALQTQKEVEEFLNELNSSEPQDGGPKEKPKFKPVLKKIKKSQAKKAKLKDATPGQPPMSQSEELEMIVEENENRRTKKRARAAEKQAKA